VLSLVECALPSQGEEAACFTAATGCGEPRDGATADAMPAFDATSADATSVDATAGDSGSVDAPGDTSTGHLDASADAADAQDEAVDGSGDEPQDGAAADGADGEGLDGTGDDGSDAGTDAAPDAPDSGACNGLTNDAQPVAEVDVPGSSPPAAGGAVVSGTYFLTSYTVYGGTTGGLTLQITASVLSMTAGGSNAGSGTIQLIENVNGGADATSTETYNVMFGTVLRPMLECGDGGSILDMSGTGFGYTATPTHITLDSESPTLSVVLVFAKQ
jgi:hypothetical protein